MTIASRNQEVINDGAAEEDLLTQATSHPKPQPKAGAGGSHWCQVGADNVWYIRASEDRMCIYYYANIYIISGP